MVFNIVTEDAFTELSCLVEKAKVALDCMIDDMNAREQTLTYIASDYLAAMDEMIQAMQESRVKAPPITPNHV